jgi:hypothetical protein
MALYKISSSRVNNIEADQYAGGTNELGLIWYDEITGALRLYTGLPGGQIINGGGGGTPGGSNTQVQFNNNGTFGGSAGLTFDSATGLLTAGSVAATGNISAQYFVGNGSQLTGIPSGYTNANVAAYLPTYTGNLVSLAGDVTTTGNVSGSYIIGNGSLLTGITSTLPPQTGQQGKYLSTNGTAPSWQTVAGVFGLTIDGGDAAFASTDFVIDAGGA